MVFIVDRLGNIIFPPTDASIDIALLLILLEKPVPPSFIFIELITAEQLILDLGLECSLLFNSPGFLNWLLPAFLAAACACDGDNPVRSPCSRRPIMNTHTGQSIHIVRFDRESSGLKIFLRDPIGPLDLIVPWIPGHLDPSGTARLAKTIGHDLCR